jgi:hypothetical protein
MVLRKISLRQVGWPFAYYTTISENARSLYDNFWFDPAYVREYAGQNGVDDFDVTVFANNDKAASLAVSDHRPIWARFRTDMVDDDPSRAGTVVPPRSWGVIKRSPSEPAQLAPKTASGSALINLNTSTQAELESLLGVGPVIAQRIIAGRPYKKVADLRRVKGIGVKKMARIESIVTVK